MMISHRHLKFWVQLLLVCVITMSGALPALAQGSSPNLLRLPVLQKQWVYVAPPTLQGIEIPKENPTSCQPFSTSREPLGRVTISKDGPFIENQIILTGKPADITQVAGRALGVQGSLRLVSLSYLAEYANQAPTQEARDALRRYSQMSMGLYSGGSVSGVPRSSLEAMRTALQYALQQNLTVFPDVNYVTGYPPITGSPWDVAGSPWGVEASPWDVAGSPWDVAGSPIYGTPAEKLAGYQTIAERTFWTQWAFQSGTGVGTYTREYVRQLSSSADGTGTQVALFDTAPYTTAGLHIETRKQLTVNLCVDLLPLPVPEIPADKTGYMRDHGLFGAGLVYASAPQTQLELIRVLDDNAVGDLFTLIQGINGFTHAKALTTGGHLAGNVYNFSLGLRAGPDSLPDDIRKLIQTLYDRVPVAERPELINGMPLPSLEAPLYSAYYLGAVLIASAGNGSANLASPLPAEIPGAYSKVLAVASSNLKGSHACYSNAGEVHTPGADGGVRPSDCVPHLELCRADADCEYGLISLVSMPADTVGFAYWVGTSFAAPLVSGIAADALENGVPPEKVTTYIVDSAVRTGVVDASAATKP